MTSNHADEQITLREYLQDPIFKKWMMRLPVHQFEHPSGLPWRVWAQRDRGGKWAKRDFATYSEAFNFMVKKLLRGGFHDFAVSARIEEFWPPAVRRGIRRERYIPAVPGQHELHRWCPHCRRPTVFTSFLKHHAFAGWSSITSARRCSICGIAITALRKRV